MKLSNLYESLLTEKVYGGYAIVYHRTKVEDLASKIYTSGFKPGTGAMYGKGFYATYDLESQMKPQMEKTYGPIVVKFAVPIDNFMIFDYDAFIQGPLSKKIKEYDQSNFIYKQLDYFDMKYSKEHLDKKLKSQFSSEIAVNCVDYIPDFTRKCNGIVFTGSRDGKVLVCYLPNTITPIGVKSDKAKNFKKITDKDIDYLKNVWKTREKEQIRDPKLAREVTPEDFGIYSYKFNKDGTLDVFENVHLMSKNLSKLPYNFGIVEGDFYCDNNKLTSLQGAPKVVKGFFDCRNNQLTSLREAPKVVTDFYCEDNKLTSLQGAPKVVEGNFWCHNNKLTSLKGCPQVIKGFFDCRNNQLTSLEGAPKVVKGNFYCSNNKLTSLKGAPKVVEGNFWCHENEKKFTEEEVRSVCNVGRSISV